MLDAVEITQKKFRVKKIGLYDGHRQEEYSVRGYTQLDIFDKSLADFWTSEGKTCISEKLIEEGDDKILNLKWNKDQDGCNWVGMGFGWDGWKGKDMGYVIDTLAIEILVRSTGDDFSNIPWAFCLEDYSGTQSWLGYNTSFLQTKSISKEWSSVLIPLSLFPIEVSEINTTNIKQLLIQVFSEGEIDIQSIKLVPFEGKLEKEAKATVQNIVVDGDLSEWTTDFNSFEGQQFSIAYSEEQLYFAFKIMDDTPRQNAKEQGELWDGDAVEIAFSTNPNADSKRSFLLLSDQHIGVNCGEDPYIWNWKINEKIEGAQISVNSSGEGYIVEIGLPTTAFRKFNLKKGFDLDLEIAIDLGTKKGRQSQLRWNSGSREGFHLSPSLWGTLRVM